MFTGGSTHRSLVCRPYPWLHPRDDVDLCDAAGIGFCDGGADQLIISMPAEREAGGYGIKAGAASAAIV